ncbi:hypothetical protein SCORR_v1c04660 [Spiroplasma corruscae]|uniref:Uncharacterized protein n=1 Tax=Spiroplasma corruscae TaxID=216934 RepID=A0A222EP06_9MOLU|nr:hypothetical protein [Spiroplasma corruscae]ASP28238.1 hypothetical protein SCORR_v1c04660 [Spiroplasma corruscae]
MAFTIDQIKEYWSENWRHENVLGLSKLAALFPNELKQDGGQMNSIIKVPVMTEVETQQDFKQETGFVETNAHEKIVQMKLTENFTSYTKILPENIPGPNWAENKMIVIERQEAAKYDAFALKTICEGVKNFMEYEEVNEKNFISIFKKIEKEAKKHKFEVSNAIFLISPKIATIIANSKLNSLSYDLENTSIVINQILNKYYCVEADIDDYGYDIIALVPSAYVWASYVETPLQSGVYTQGPFYGQIFTVINKWYNGEVIMDEHILAFKNSKNTSPESKSAD